MASPVVTVLIATYNRAAWLGEAIESVLAQTYADYEIVVVDDGSVDGTREVAAAFGARIRYIHQPNQGKASAQNRGLREARGTYVALLDDDDIWLPDKLAIQLAVLEAEPDLGFVCGGAWLVTAAGEPIAIWRRTASNRECFENLYQENFIQHSSVVVRRDLIERVGGLDVSLRTTEDYDLWLRLARHAPFRYIDRPLVKYRQHPGGKHLNTAQKLKDRVRVVTRPEHAAHLTWRQRRTRAAREYVIHAGYFEDAGRAPAATRAYLGAIGRDPLVGLTVSGPPGERLRNTAAYRVARPYLKVLHNLWRALSSPLHRRV
jgi:GT2 family glycosyltransferase